MILSATGSFVRWCPYRVLHDLGLIPSTRRRGPHNACWQEPYQGNCHWRQVSISDHLPSPPQINAHAHFHTYCTIDSDLNDTVILSGKREKWQATWYFGIVIDTSKSEVNLYHAGLHGLKGQTFTDGR